MQSEQSEEVEGEGKDGEEEEGATAVGGQVDPTELSEEQKKKDEEHEKEVKVSLSLSLSLPPFCWTVEWPLLLWFILVDKIARKVPLIRLPFYCYLPLSVLTLCRIEKSGT